MTAAVQAMIANRVGAALVMDGDRLAGIFTERDLLNRVVGQGLDPAAEKVADHLTADVITARLDDPLEKVLKAMIERHIRHLPVLDEEGRVADLITNYDIMNLELVNRGHLIQQLETYISGDMPGPSA